MSLQPLTNEELDEITNIDQLKLSYRALRRELTSTKRALEESKRMRRAYYNELADD